MQNFFSAATGLVVAMALMRGFARHGQPTLSNLWVDLNRCILWILPPLSLALAVRSAGIGVVRSFQGSLEVHTLQGATQALPLGRWPNT